MQSLSQKQDAQELKIFLYNGSQIHPIFSDGMYRASIEGRSYCSSSLSGLINALGFFYSIYTKTDEIPEPERKESVVLGEILASPAKMEEKQKSFLRLKVLADGGDQVAGEIISIIKSRPISFGASIVARWAGVSDFAEISPVAISDMVGDAIHRASLLKELSDRISLESFSAKE